MKLGFFYRTRSCFSPSELGNFGIGNFFTVARLWGRPVPESLNKMSPVLEYCSPLWSEVCFRLCSPYAPLSAVQQSWLALFECLEVHSLDDTGFPWSGSSLFKFLPFVLVTLPICLFLRLGLNWGKEHSVLFPHLFGILSRLNWNLSHSRSFCSILYDGQQESLGQCLCF